MDPFWPFNPMLCIFSVVKKNIGQNDGRNLDTCVKLREGPDTPQEMIYKLRSYDKEQPWEPG